MSHMDYFPLHSINSCLVPGFTFQESEIGTEREQEQSEYESATEDNEVGQLRSIVIGHSV